jgi:hypothetical protein
MDLLDYLEGFFFTLFSFCSDAFSKANRHKFAVDTIVFFNNNNNNNNTSDVSSSMEYE